MNHASFAPSACSANPGLCHAIPLGFNPDSEVAVVICRRFDRNRDLRGEGGWYEVSGCLRPTCMI